MRRVVLKSPVLENCTPGSVCTTCWMCTRDRKPRFVRNFMQGQPGIGAGGDVSGQVLVLHDMLDVYPGRKPRFVRNFMQGQPSIDEAVAAYVTAVRNRSFPAPEHGY